jgi:hypothetical protein
MSLTRLAGWILLSFEALHASPITLAPGSLLAQQPALLGAVTGNITEYTKSGTFTGTAQIVGTTDIAENLTVLSGQLFVSDGSGRVNRIDLSSGIVASSFNTGMVGLNGIGSYGGNLLTLSFSAHAVNVYSTTGLFQQSIALVSTPASFSWNGIASDGTILYLADYTSGRLYEYSPTGASLGFIDTHMGAGITGVSYDSSNNSLWISDASTNQVLDFSTSGTLLSQFSTGAFRPGSGIAVVPVPEPSCGGLFAIALAIVAASNKLERFGRIR